MGHKALCFDEWMHVLYVYSNIYKTRRDHRWYWCFLNFFCAVLSWSNPLFFGADFFVCLFWYKVFSCIETLHTLCDYAILLIWSSCNWMTFLYVVDNLSCLCWGACGTGDRPSLWWSAVQAVPHWWKPGHQLHRPQGQEGTCTQQWTSPSKATPWRTRSGPFHEATRLWSKVSSASRGLFITELLGLLPSQPWSDVMCAAVRNVSLTRHFLPSAFCIVWGLCSTLCGEKERVLPVAVEKAKNERKLKMNQFKKMLGWVNTNW